MQTPRGGYKAEDVPFGQLLTSTLPSRHHQSPQALSGSPQSPSHQRRPLLPLPPVNLGGVGRRESAESEPVGELTPRREGEWVSPDSGRETTTVAAADSGFIDDAAQLRLPPNGGTVGAAICAAAAAAVAGTSQRSDAAHDSFAFKSLLHEEVQRKDREMVGSRSSTVAVTLGDALMLTNSSDYRVRLHRCWPTTGSEVSRWSSRRAKRSSSAVRSTDSCRTSPTARSKVPPTSQVLCWS